MKIKTSDLIEVIDILKEKIKINFSDSIEIDTEDFYWHISSEELYNPVREPRELYLGQLSDDWSELLRLRDSNDEEAISHDLKRLAVILEIVQKKSFGKW